MEFNEYQTDVRRTHMPGSLNDRLCNAALGLCEEAGEVYQGIDVGRAAVRDSDFKGYARGHVLEELGDLLRHTVAIRDFIDTRTDLHMIGRPWSPPETWGFRLTTLSNCDSYWVLDSARVMLVQSAYVAGIIKKHVYVGRELNTMTIRENLTSIQYNIAGIAIWFGSSIQEVSHINVAKIQHKFPHGFVREDSK